MRVRARASPASPPGQLQPVGKERAGLGEWGASPSSRSPGSRAGARVLQSGNSGEERGVEGGGEERGGKKRGRGGESQRSSPNSEQPLSLRGAEWLANYSVRTPPPPSSTQRERRMRVEQEKGFSPFQKDTRDTSCVFKSSIFTAALPSSPPKKKSPSTQYFPAAHHLLRYPQASKCSSSAEMWYPRAPFHPPPLTPFFQLPSFLARPIPAGFGIRNRSTDLQIPVSRLRCEGNGQGMSPPPLRTAVRARGGWATTKVGMGKGSYETDF